MIIKFCKISIEAQVVGADFNGILMSTHNIGYNGENCRAEGVRCHFILM